MAAHAVLCTSCGYDLRKGKRLKPKRRKESAASEAAVTAGKFVIGIVLSSVFALVSVGVWLGIIIATDIKIGWPFAWALGGLTGLGMRLGYRDETPVSGYVAGGISFFGLGVGYGILLLAALGAQQMGEPIRMFGGWGAVFTPWDFFAFFLAIGTAYKVATGGGGD
jgi:hypothetical protein